MLGLGLKQSKIKIKNNHILPLASRKEPYKLQEFGDKTLLGHQNLHA
jgi:hypothetical protein